MAALEIRKCECEAGDCHPEGCSAKAIPENKTIYGTRLCAECWEKMPGIYRVDPNVVVELLVEDHSDDVCPCGDPD